MPDIVDHVEVSQGAQTRAEVARASAAQNK
jgi:hypothetical protein